MNELLIRCLQNNYNMSR